MTYHVQSRSFDTTAQRNALEAELKRRDFLQVRRGIVPGPLQYRLLDGTSDPNTFDGQRQFGIEWCEDK